VVTIYSSPNIPPVVGAGSVEGAEDDQTMNPGRGVWSEGETKLPGNLLPFPFSAIIEEVNYVNA
jgi:hypothetical protein